MSGILLLGLIFLFGYLGGLAANKAGLPKVSGYVIVGALMSPTVSGIISADFLASTSMVVDFALALVAYSLGGHLKVAGLREHGKTIGLMTLGQGLGAYLFITLASLFFVSSFYGGAFSMVDCVVLAFLLGAISLSTAPAATVATVHEYKAKGPFTSTLFAVVALDDALGLIAFVLTVAALKGYILDSSQAYQLVLGPILKLSASVAIGFAIGLVLVWSMKLIRSMNTLVVLTVASFTVTFGLAQQFHLEPLFATMVMGMTVANLYPGDAPFIFLEKNYESVVFAVFFVLAGAHVDVGILRDALPLALMFVVFRIAGKWLGAYLGGRAAGAPRAHNRYMGLALAPQAGIAIGLALYLERIEAFAAYAPLIMNIIVASMIINEVIGPYLLKFALQRTGEAGALRDKEN